jgi:hypothetical protein
MACTNPGDAAYDTSKLEGDMQLPNVNFNICGLIIFLEQLNLSVLTCDAGFDQDEQDKWDWRIPILLLVDDRS